MANRLIRPIRIEGNLAFITLTRGYEAVIDAADIELVSGRNWTTLITRQLKYARTTESAHNKQRWLPLHRVILNAPSGMVVDHINSDGLDNRRCNLRLATHAENCRNKRTANNNTSGAKGVYWDSQRDGWRAQITAAGRTYALGKFVNFDDAVAAYSQASMRLHGDFGRLA